jgi:hypothetical protein
LDDVAIGAIELLLIGVSGGNEVISVGSSRPYVPSWSAERKMLKVQFEGDVLAVHPEGPITRDDVATLTRTAGNYLADYAHFIADHHPRVRRIALVTDSALAPIAEFMAKYIVGVEMRHYPYAEGAAARTWLRSP